MKNPVGWQALRPLIRYRVRAAIFSDLFNVVASRPAKSPRVMSTKYRDDIGNVKWRVSMGRSINRVQRMARMCVASLPAAVMHGQVNLCVPRWGSISLAAPAT
jgi:hypothetical protein